MLDFKTLIVINLVVDVTNLVMMAALWRNYRARVDGLSFWLAGMAVQVVGISLILGRGTLPMALAILGGNAVMMSAPLLFHAGVARFVGRPVRPWPALAAYAAFLIAFHHHTMTDPSQAARTIALSLLIAFVFGRTCRMILVELPPDRRRPVRIITLTLAGYVAVSLIRVAILVGLGGESDIVRAGVVDSVAVAAYIALHMLSMIAIASALSRRLLDEVLAQEEKFAQAFRAAPYALVIVRRRDGVVVDANDGFFAIFGHRRADAPGRPLGLPPGPPFDGGELDGAREFETRTAAGAPLVGQFTSAPLRIGGEACVLWTIKDVTEESRMRRELLEHATTDALTGLPNRRLFAERFEIARLYALRGEGRMAVLCVDLDRFKAVNDDLGHAAGDAVLVEAAGRFRDCLRKVDVVARFGGDEFVILLSEIHGADDAAQVAAKVVAAFREPFRTPERGVAISASVGIAIFPDHGEDLADLLRAADGALYAVKAAGRDGHRLAGSRDGADDPPCGTGRDGV